MQKSEIDTPKHIDSSSPNYFRLFVYVVAAVIFVVILVATLDLKFLK
ncbi:MAG: hypothetical protein DID92_2727744727 [Candidatus Nitrotoga sp. SPKER]|nr:MAG: hypothetical protein DID92_2727744727 [Candidatus Nitrotoga sp. SPKER]